MHGFSLSTVAVLSAANAVVTILVLNSIRDVAKQSYDNDLFRRAAITLFLLFAMLLLNIVTQYISSNLGSRLVSGFRVNIALRLARQSYELFLEQKHSFIGVVTQDIGRVAMLVAMVPALAYNTLIFVGCVTYLLVLSLKLFCILILGLLVPIFLFFGFRKIVRVKFDGMRRADEKVFEHFRAIADGKRELILSKNRFRFFFNDLLLPEIRKSEDAAASAQFFAGMLQAGSSFFIYTVIFCIIMTGRFGFGLSLDVIVPFIVGTIFLTGPLTFLLQLNQQVGPGLASVRHLERLGGEADGIVSGPLMPSGVRDDTKAGRWNSICVKAVSYYFPSVSTNENHSLGPLDFSIYRGEIIFIAGSNGAGKSTLLHLLCGIIQPKSGSILIDGVDVWDDIDSYRELFSGVFYDFFLFRDILDESGHILQGRDFDVLFETLKLNDAHASSVDSVSRDDFSAGQRKRFALMQCIAGGGDVLFFDEWAAEQDSEFRRYFYRVLLPSQKALGKTIIAISHDDNYFDIADRVIRIESGKLVSESISTNGSVMRRSAVVQPEGI